MGNVTIFSTMLPVALMEAIVAVQPAILTRRILAMNGVTYLWTLKIAAMMEVTVFAWNWHPQAHNAAPSQDPSGVFLLVVSVQRAV